ncbi:MAG TPA: MJ0042-type zinc finger domain-containing protein [Pseudolabrys sp.]|jgi:predicted Zn finger-like uncharacterized protein
MLIVCPNCATSYLIDPASVGSAGRTVRCARCKTTWFAAQQKSNNDVSAFVNGVIAEAEAQANDPIGSHTSPPNDHPIPGDVPAASDDFGHESDAPLPSLPEATSPFGSMVHNNDLTPPDEMSPPLTVTDAPSLVPPIDHAPLSEPDPEESAAFLARRERLKAKRKSKKSSSRWTAIILLLFAFNVALIGARSEVVRYLPQTASLFSAIGLPVNLRNLKFDNVRITKENADGMNVLVVEGSIVSTSGKAAEVPRLRFAARNATGQEVYTWTALPGRSVIGPDEALPFSSRLVSPPADAVDVMVRFFSAQDAGAGSR